MKPSAFQGDAGPAAMLDATGHRVGTVAFLNRVSQVRFLPRALDSYPDLAQRMPSFAPGTGLSRSYIQDRVC